MMSLGFHGSESICVVCVFMMTHTKFRGKLEPCTALRRDWRWRESFPNVCDAAAVRMYFLSDLCCAICPFQGRVGNHMLRTRFLWVNFDGCPSCDRTSRMLPRHIGDVQLTYLTVLSPKNASWGGGNIRDLIKKFASIGRHQAAQRGTLWHTCCGLCASLFFLFMTLTCFSEQYLLQLWRYCCACVYLVKNHARYLITIDVKMFTFCKKKNTKVPQNFWVS